LFRGIPAERFDEMPRLFLDFRDEFDVPLEVVNDGEVTALKCVFRLAQKVGTTLPDTITNTQKLELVQEKLEAGHEGAIQIWQSIGDYLGYAITHYADFHDLKHVLILGRCTLGRGGPIVITVSLPDSQTQMTQIHRRLTLI